MAGMFYSLKETAEKLGIAEDDVKQLAEDGKLREFRDGSSLLFKIEEVEGLLAGGPAVEQEPEAVVTDVEEVLELEPVMEEPAEEEALVEEAAPELDLELEPEPELEMTAEADTAGEMELAPDLETGAELEMAADTSSEFSEDDILADMGDVEPVGQIDEDGESEISLAPETGMLGAESDITDMDTALAGEGINVLGETDADYDVTDDSLAETVGPAGTSTEASLEEIEDDVNLDSFGSGSGLLDLSLQADDTSLGGILDEIYTADGGDEAPADGGESDMLDDMTAEAEHVTEEELAAPEPMVAVPTVATAFAEVAPDTQSNMLGILLFLPLLALLYAAIVTVSAQRGVMPSILESIQGMVWYLMGGAVVVAIMVAGASFVVGNEKKPRAPKAKKAKKEKKPKEKKAKKEKAPKAEKPKKAKKSLFGKKK